MDKSTLYLVVYHDKVNPAHWQLLLLADQGSSENAVGGTTIEVVSSYYGGFEHKISHGYNEADSESRHSKIFLGLIDFGVISNVEFEQCALSTDANGLDCNLKVEEVNYLFYFINSFFGISERKVLYSYKLAYFLAPGIQLPDLDQGFCRTVGESWISRFGSDITGAECTCTLIA